MTTPDEQAEWARVDRWIASWNANQILAYDKAVAEREELHRKCEERERANDDGFTLPERLKEWEAEHDFGEHVRRRFPVGAFFDSIEEDRDGDWRPSLTKLCRSPRRRGTVLRRLGHIAPPRSSWRRPRPVGSAGRRRAAGDGQVH